MDAHRMLKILPDFFIKISVDCTAAPRILGTYSNKPNFLLPPVTTGDTVLTRTEIFEIDTLRSGNPIYHRKWLFKMAETVA